jgi:hypothetical protein
MPTEAWTEQYCAGLYVDRTVLQCGAPQMRPVPYAGIRWLGLPVPVGTNAPTMRDFMTKDERERGGP